MTLDDNLSGLSVVFLLLLLLFSLLFLTSLLFLSMSFYILSNMEQYSLDCLFFLIMKLSNSSFIVEFFNVAFFNDCNDLLPIGFKYDIFLLIDLALDVVPFC